MSNHGRKQGIQWLEEYDSSLPDIPADEFYLERLIYNLLINALHWAPRGGWVRIKTGRLKAPRPDGVFLEVSDNGPGFPRSRSRSFSKNTTSSAAKGTALRPIPDWDCISRN